MRGFGTRPVEFGAHKVRGEEHEGNAFVLDSGDEPPILCFGTVADTGVPQCGGVEIRVANWQWDNLPDVESARGARWGHYFVTGTFDGESFTLTAPPTEPVTGEAEFSTACPEPEGGWRSPRPDDASQADLEAASLYAERQPDFAGVWADYSGETTPDAGVVLNVAFTGDLPRHEADIRRIWGGPLCLVTRDRTMRDLDRIYDEARDVVTAELGLQFAASGRDHVHTQIEMYVVVATDEDQRLLDDRFGEGAIDLIPALRPVQAD